MIDSDRPARRAHEGKTDKLGDDYITHPQRVAERALFMAPAEDRFDCAAAGWGCTMSSRTRKSPSRTCAVTAGRIASSTLSTA